MGGGGGGGGRLGAGGGGLLYEWGLWGGGAEWVVGGTIGCGVNHDMCYSESQDLPHGGSFLSDWLLGHQLCASTCQFISSTGETEMKVCMGRTGGCWCCWWLCCCHARF